jgi:glutamate racemase
VLITRELTVSCSANFQEHGYQQLLHGYSTTVANTNTVISRYTRKSITNTSTSTKIKKKSKSFLGWIEKKLSDEKTRDEVSRDILP